MRPRYLSVSNRWENFSLDSSWFSVFCAFNTLIKMFRRCHLLAARRVVNFSRVSWSPRLGSFRRSNASRILLSDTTWCQLFWLSCSSISHCVLSSKVASSAACSRNRERLFLSLANVNSHSIELTLRLSDPSVSLGCIRLKNMGVPLFLSDTLLAFVERKLFTLFATTDGG